MKLTPMMQQYMDIKNKYNDCILFFRLGDFYEMFFEDAILASRELEITLTGKSCGQDEKAPMCGVPFHAAESYIAKLVDKGYKVAIGEQVEDVNASKGIVKREVVQVITPGTIISKSMLREKENNFIASLYVKHGKIGLSYCDISTGELYCTKITGVNFYENLLNELVKIHAKEILINKEAEDIINVQDLLNVTGGYITKIDKFYKSYSMSENIIFMHFKINSLSAIGLLEYDEISYSLGGLLEYIINKGKNKLNHILELKHYNLDDFMSLDKSTLRNLEITETLYEKKIKGSLLEVLDKTETSMGSRRLKQWLKEPLNNIELIQKRLNSVEILMNNFINQENIRNYLKKIYDLERLSGRIASKNANGKDLISLKKSVEILPELKNELNKLNDKLLNDLSKDIDEKFDDIYHMINNSINEDAPYSIKDGNLIKKGYSNELDNLRESIVDGQKWIASLEDKERERTGIKSLKVRFNKVFGYYIEITKTNLDMVPENYIRKQTLVNCERYITPKLKEIENIVLNAEIKINIMEYNIFCGIRDELEKYIKILQKASSAISSIDVLVSYAKVSEDNNYVKPEIIEDDIIEIINGRHPVVEKNIDNGLFVSNDLNIDKDKQSMLLITGPNMAGKSTYMRQNALILLMAQAGCFVPCEKAKISIVDKIYTRIGASDNLARGQSTFFVEMSELAYILNTATEKSLIILDEIGRGTSTYDGLSIAEATIQYLCNNQKQIRTLFATHYHELTSLENNVKGIKNLNVDVIEENGNIVFLHKIVKGYANESYGIHVAKLAGVPKDVLEKAIVNLNKYENKLLQDTNSKNNNIISENNNYQIKMNLVNENKNINKIYGMIDNLDLMNLAPWEALKVLEDIKNVSKNKNIK